MKFKVQSDRVLYKLSLYLAEKDDLEIQKLATDSLPESLYRHWWFTQNHENSEDNFILEAQQFSDSFFTEKPITVTYKVACYR